MSKKLIGQLVAIGSALWLSAGVARAQTAPTCSYDGDTATVTVTVDGLAATVSRNVPGVIRLNNVPCGAATVTNTDTIVVNGGALDDRVTFNGEFVPGLTAELGTSEIEISIGLGDGSDTAVVNFTDNPETIMFTATGIDVGNDGDEDTTTAGTEIVRTYGKAGDDTIDASAYLGGGKLYLYGGNGIDGVTGSTQNDNLYGQDDPDTLNGGLGNDTLTGGPGDDDMFGGAGNDRFLAEGTVDGDDDMNGGADRDTIDYSKRGIGVNVTLGNGMADDGEAGNEFDFADAGIEVVIGGRGDDTLVGDDLANTLDARAGDDQLFGGLGNDIMRGGDGADVMAGDLGNDTMYGEAGGDTIEGDDGNDNLFGGFGNDFLDGGVGDDDFFGEAGNDVFINDDGVAETIDCGTGPFDDPEPSVNDTFIGCELI